MCSSFSQNNNRIKITNRPNTFSLFLFLLFRNIVLLREKKKKKIDRVHNSTHSKSCGQKNERKIPLKRLLTNDTVSCVRSSGGGSGLTSQ